MLTHDGRPASQPRWRPRLGAWLDAGAVTFRVWAPARTRVELVLHPGLPTAEARPLTRLAEGMFTATFADVRGGDLYAYRLDGEGPFPDPASRFQPQGVHGPSAVVDSGAFRWADDAWPGVALRDAVIYELHVGTFTPSGTFAAVADRLPSLAELGITVVELMPIADFPGSRNWGYDGVSLFAPSRAYGAPDDLRALIDAAHRVGLAVALDVVYNHFGPDGAYASLFSPFYFSTRHRSPWGAAVNLDGEGSDHVREFFIENALYWLHEFHFDGLRLDATHGLADASPRHLVAELAARARESLPHREVLIMAEDDRNLATIVRPSEVGGWGLDAVWADDFHHQVRRLAAGDRDGYYADYSGTIADLAQTIRHGWFYQGQFSAYHGKPRGTSPAGIPLARMIICLQNHDQIGNRPFGGRLNHQIEPALFRALSALLLFLPETPLLFMGQEWAASTPFLFFTDHHEELGRLITAGRREEFSRFEAFADPLTRSRIPDPQARSTFETSRLVWREREQGVHAGMLTLYRTLLRLRHSEPALLGRERLDVAALDNASLAVSRGGERDTLVLVVCTSSSHRVDLTTWRALGRRQWEVVLSTEESRFANPLEPGLAGGSTIDLSNRGLAVSFDRPAAVILRVLP